MAEQKLSTADILAKIRAGKTGAAEPVAAAPVSSSTTEAASPAAVPVADATAPAKPAVAKPATSGAKPTSTADILAAIRGKGAPPASSTGEPVAAKAVPAAKPVATAASTGAPKPSVEEMLKAVRSGGVAPGQAEANASAVKASLPPIPMKPVAAKEKKGAIPRSSFLAICLSPLVVGFTAMALTGLDWLLALARFMFPNVLVEPPTKFKIGSLSDYPLGTVSTKWLAARGVWIVHTDQYKGKNTIYALASVCTHLGCTPNWLEGEQKYKCPCHGSGFYVTGINFEGPAPRPLERVGIRVAPDGQLEVDKSVKFQEEMGQWEDGNSYVDASLA